MSSDKFIAIYDGNTMNVEDGLTLWVPCNVDEERIFKDALLLDYVEEIGQNGGDPAMQIFNTPTIKLVNGAYTNKYAKSGRFVAMYDSDFMAWRTAITFYIDPRHVSHLDSVVTSSLPYQAYARRPPSKVREGHCGYLSMAVPTEFIDK